ncbi:MAG: hypothetical protein MUC53_00170 [Candidatus Contendobacter sp.]|jgi:hypothetical protein|nr:hypothetical protein [Candidatus Contendobacter sp.]
MNKTTTLRLARRIARLAGFTAAPYIVYGTGSCARGPYNGTAAGRLAAARAFRFAPSPDGATLYAGDVVIARDY